MAITSKLILDALRVLGIKLRRTLLRWGIFVSKNVKFEVLFTWQLISYKRKAKQNSLCVFEELVFFDLQIPVSGFRVPVYWVLGLPPSLTVYLLHI